jgi:hypothetical protein
MRRAAPFVGRCGSQGDSGASSQPAAVRRKALESVTGGTYSHSIANDTRTEEPHMTATATTAAFRTDALQPLLSAPLRAVTAALVVAALSAAWLTTEQASHEAVQTVTQSIQDAGIPHITLSRVEIVGRKQPA